jgi:hypothetical protein
MTRDEFEASLDRYGPDLSQWPEPLRAPAGDLLAKDAAAARHLADARQLQQILAEAVGTVPVDAALIGRILAGAGRRHRAGAIPLRATPRLAALASIGLVAVLAIGFTAGYLQPADDDDMAVAALVFAGDDPGAGL